MTRENNSIARIAADSAARAAVEHAAARRAAQQTDPQAPVAPVSWWRRVPVWAWPLLLGGVLLVLLVAPAVLAVALTFFLGHPLAWLMATAGASLLMARRRGVSPETWAGELRATATGRHRRTLVVAGAVGAVLGVACGVAGEGVAAYVEAVPSVAELVVLITALFLRRWRP